MAGAAGDECDARHACDARPGVGHVHGGGLVADVDELETRVERGIEDRHHVVAREREDAPHAATRKASREAVGPAPGARAHASASSRNVAAATRSAVIGKSRTRTPIASRTALAIAAVTGPCAASPAPIEGSSARWSTSTSTRGTSEKRRIG